MRSDTGRKGSNRMGDEDGRRYNDQVLTGGPLRTLARPPGTRMKNAGVLKWSRFTHKEPNSMGYTHQLNPRPLLYVQREINEYQRDEAWIYMWIPYAWRLSVKKGGIWRETQQKGGEESEEEGRREFCREGEKFPDTECTAEPSSQEGAALQREYAWRGEHCSGNNKVVKSLSPQAARMAHLGLMAGVLFLSLRKNTPHFSLLSSNL